MALCLIHNADVMSDLLTIREKGVLVSLLSPHCQLLKSTVAQVLQTSSAPGETQSWECFSSGVLCLVKDKSASSYFLHLYCVKKKELLWEQELRVTSEYTVSRPYFHTLLAGVQQFGLNFANDDEAEEFHFAVMDVHERRTNQSCPDHNRLDWLGRFSGPVPGLGYMTTAPNAQPNSEYQPEADLNWRTDFPVEAQPRTAHEDTRAFVDLDPAIERVLARAGLRKDDLKDKDVSEAADLIISRFGGVKAVQQELKKAASQTLPRAAGGFGS
ncbi:Neural Wiskott-Aldrich syndrome protein [Oryzias melastigma]|uniref:Neural Wiskott-Aldrich syndrome protein n=1 Tax=Oryzias melastigma TaxID=30732 RepID=A0A834CUX0_ORYME|nr:Neural Wiskott-Aldrich syndrome protein [Oryzias melastigma]